MSSKLIIIDTAHKISGTTSNFVVDLNNSTLRNVRSVSLVALRTINSQPNVATGVNDVISYNYNGVDKTIVIPEGQYSITEFIDYINGAQSDFTVGLNDLVSKLEWQSAGFPLTIKKDTVSDELIGVTEDLVDSVGGAVMTSQHVPDLSGLSIIHVSSPELAGGNSIISDGSHGDIFSSIPVNAQYGFPIVYTSETSDQSDNIRYKTPTDINKITIRLTDHGYRPVRLYSPVHMIFKVFQSSFE